MRNEWSKQPARIVLLLLMVCTYARGQEKRATTELSLTTENDVYLFDISDCYYSNGIQLDWRKVLPPASGFSRWAAGRGVRKVMMDVQVNQRIYTPLKIFKKSVDKIDRPYAGWLYAGSNLSFFGREKTVFTVGADLGVTGPWSAAEWTQKRWHSWFGMPTPLNWQYQIRNAVVGHLNLKLQRQLLRSKSADLLSETTIRTGNLLNNVRQGFTLRLGDIEPLYHSLYTNSRLDHTVSDEQYKRREFYWFGNVTLERVFSNGLIDGKLLDGRYLPTGHSLPWVVHYRWGVQYGNHRWNLTLAVNHLSSEFRKGQDHYYGSIGIGFRF